MKRFLQASFISLSVMLFAIMSGCASNEANSSPQQAASSSDMSIYEVHHDGRIHVFYDQKLYKEFLALGETPFRFTKIGAGPNGETLVFGLTKKDKKMKAPIAAIELYDGKIKPAGFYGEMRKHGRIYVFSNFNDMNTVRAFGHPNYMFTQIGAGPKGETLVYVLNKSNKKKRPDALIAEFKKHNS